MATTKGSASAREPITQENRWRAIKERSTRGLLTYNADGVHHLEGDLWAVASTLGGFWHVDLAEEVCDCPDFEYFGSEHDVNCRHIIAVAIAHGTRRSRRPCACMNGVVYIGHMVEQDGETVEVVEAVRCRRCEQESV